MGKLPRRVMSMSKRADKLASDLHEVLLGEGEEEEEQSSPSPEGEEGGHPPAWAYIGAWLAGVAFLLMVVLGTRLIFTIGTDVDVPLGVQTREVSEPEYQAARDALREPTPTPATTTSAPVSRSGGATSGMRCEYSAHYTHDVCFPPDGTLTSEASSIPAHYHPPEQGTATVGGTTVPELECEEDEVIGFFGVPNTLACIHIDSFRVAPR